MVCILSNNQYCTGICCFTAFCCVIPLVAIRKSGFNFPDINSLFDSSSVILAVPCFLRAAINGTKLTGFKYLLTMACENFQMVGFQGFAFWQKNILFALSAVGYNGVGYKQAVKIVYMYGFCQAVTASVFI